MSTTVYQLEPRSVRGDGMSYVILADDGSVIVIDGGHDDESDGLLELLRLLTKSSVPHVDTWIITHAHLDHTACLTDMAKRHFNDFTLGRLCYNFPDERYFSLSQPVALKEINEMLCALQKVDYSYFKPVKGDSFSFGDTRLDFLFSWEELGDLGSSPLNINDTSLVFTVSDPGQRVIFLADAEERTARILNRNYGKALKCDVCQVAHHGCTHGWDKDVAELYCNIDPVILLWPVSEKNLESYLDFSLINRYILKQLNIKDCYISGKGAVGLCLPVEVRKEPYVPSVPQYAVKDEGDISRIPLLERGADISRWDDPVWDKCLRIELFAELNESADEVSANALVGAFGNKLFFKLRLFKAHLPSAPQFKSSLDTNCFRIYFTDEPILDYGVFWDQIKGKKGSFNDLKLYLESKDWVGENTRRDISQSCIHPLDGGCGVCMSLEFDGVLPAKKRIAMVIEANAVDTVGGRRVVSLRNVDGEDRKVFYIKPAGLKLFEIS